MVVKLLFGVSVLALGSSMGLFGWNTFRPDPCGEAAAHLRAGTELLEGRRLEPAVRELSLALAVEEDSLRLTAHHNLGLALLHLALDGEGRPALTRVGEAVHHLERALEVRPGLEAPAWNLELALRRQAELEGDLRRSGEEESRRLLATFRLQEEEKLGSLRLPGSGRAGDIPTTSKGRGPPW